MLNDCSFRKHSPNTTDIFQEYQYDRQKKQNQHRWNIMGFEKEELVKIIVKNQITKIEWLEDAKKIRTCLIGYLIKFPLLFVLRN